MLHFVTAVIRHVAIQTKISIRFQYLQSIVSLLSTQRNPEMFIVPFQQVSPSGSCRGSVHSLRLLSSLDCQRYPFQQKDELPERERRKSGRWRGKIQWRQTRQKHSDSTIHSPLTSDFLSEYAFVFERVLCNTKSVQSNMQFPWRIANIIQAMLKPFSIDVYAQTWELQFPLCRTMSDTICFYVLVVIIVYFELSFFQWTIWAETTLTV